jgi:hypothetical protein
LAGAGGAASAVRNGHTRLPATRDVYLVRRRDETAFTMAAFSLAGLAAGTPLKIEISGSMPPYHFAGGGSSAWNLA